jgi:hypothetical protein
MPKRTTPPSNGSTTVNIGNHAGAIDRMAAARAAKIMVPPNETARERFLRVGQPRVAHCIKAIRLLGNLARGNYEWDDADVEAIKAILTLEIELILREFDQRTESAGVSFSFEKAAEHAM